MSLFWVGEIPSRPVSVRVFDSKGQYVDLAGYKEIRVAMLDTDNNPVDLDDAVIDLVSPETGTFNLRFPKNKSIFKNAGEYVLQVELVGDGTLDLTNTITFLVRSRGRLIK